MKLPKPTELLNGNHYWRVEVFWQFLENCIEVAFENPTAGLELAKHAPALAKLTAPDSDLLALNAYAVLGSAHRALGDRQHSEIAFAKALAYGERLPAIETVDTKRRLAYLRIDQRRFAEAEALTTEAIEIFRRDGDLTNRQPLGRCYVVLGNVYCEQGLNDRAVLNYITALSHLDIRQRFQDYYGTIHNLAVALVDCKSPKPLGQALSLLAKARRRLPRGHNLAKAKLRWLKGLIATRFGSTRQAERELLGALDALTKLGAVFEAALVALDLAVFYLEQMESLAVIRKLAEDTYRFFSATAADAEALAALRIWRDAEVINAGLLLSIRETVARRTIPAMQPANVSDL